MHGYMWTISVLRCAACFLMVLHWRRTRSNTIAWINLNLKLRRGAAKFYVFAGETLHPSIPFYVLGGLLLICALAMPFLPETANSSLPTTMEEAIELENYRFIRCASEFLKIVGCECFSTELTWIDLLFHMTQLVNRNNTKTHRVIRKPVVSEH